MTGVKHKTIPEALQWVADHPQPSNDDFTKIPVWELVTREHLTTANHPDPRVRGSMARATRAQRMLLDRLVGTRRPGTHPAQVTSEELHIVDLTVGVLTAPETAEEAPSE